MTTRKILEQVNSAERGRGLSRRWGAIGGSGSEVTGRDDLAQHLLGVAPEFRATVGDLMIACHHAIMRDAVTLPGRALRATVEQHGLKPIDGRGELGFGSRLRLELIPEGAKGTRLVRRQQAEDAGGRDGFAFVLVRHGRDIVGEGVAGIDFHEIVDDEHFQHAKDIEIGDVRMFRKDDDAETEVPGVLGVVFGSAALRVDRLAKNFLQFVALGNELDLMREALGSGGKRVGS